MTDDDDDDGSVIARLIALGLSSREAARKAPIFAANDRALDAWREADAREREADEGRLRWFVPGRIEVLGKHTDYAGGRSLICAVERGFCVTAVPRADDTLRVVDVVHQVEAQFRVHADQPEDTRWRRYIATVARRIARNFPPVEAGLSAAAIDAPSAGAHAGEAEAGGAFVLRGADLAFGSDLPRAAGVSSSTALIIAVFTALAEINALDRHPAYRANIASLEALAAYLGCIENGRTFGTLVGDRGVGTLGGSQDHTAILRAEPGCLVAFGYSPPRVEQIVALPAGLTFLIGSSGVAAEKTGAARDDYNRASQAVAAILDVWRAAGGHAADDATLFDIVTAGADAADSRSVNACVALRRVLAGSRDARFPREALIARLDHFVREALEIIPQATAALARADLTAFGALVDQSQAAAERWLANQIPETIALARLARARGALAASSFGAGFGGSVWALVRADDAAVFLADWQRAYLEQFPTHADRAIFFATSAGPPCSRV